MNRATQSLRDDRHAFVPVPPRPPARADLLVSAAGTVVLLQQRDATYLARPLQLHCQHGQPLTVILPQIRHDLNLVVNPEPTWTDPVPDWCGVPCRIGRVTIWLPVLGSNLLRGFSVLALLPRATPPDQPPFIQLGMQFFLEYAATLTFDCSSASPVSSVGRLLIP